MVSTEYMKKKLDHKKSFLTLLKKFLSLLTVKTGLLLKSDVNLT